MLTSYFRGLNNVTDPFQLGAEWLGRADNVNITNAGTLTKREGYALSEAGNFASAYSTDDTMRAYVSVDGILRTLEGVALVTLQSQQPLSWCEVNDQVMFDNGTDSGIIQPDNAVLPWRDSPLTDIPAIGADGAPLDSLYSPLPYGTRLIQHWRGRIYAAQYMAEENQTVVWFSQPLGFHLFNLDTDFILLPGRVDMLAPHSGALVIGTDAAIYAYGDEGLTELADYGVVPGQHWVKDDERILFWSQRGVCAAVPFQNLTERQVSVAPGVRACGCLVQRKGQKRYLAVLQRGSDPFNAF